MDMDERIIDGDKIDEIMLPGFRFHPTDEELVAFYLKRKIHQKPLAIELIKQLDIYKHDPWDLPKLAATGEKEWYFYCPRDRKYRNSARPNRVTSAGFWKATGTDRPIYSSEGITKCIGLKKSLVFYKGRAAKGIKTDWMMHEFRLPSSLVDSVHPKSFIDKAIPANDAWAICRIFKKTNTTAQRAASNFCVRSPSPDHNQIMLPKCGGQTTQLSSMTPNHIPNFPLKSYNTLHQQHSCPPTFSSPDLNYHKPIYMSTSHTLQAYEADANSILSNLMLTHDNSSYELMNNHFPTSLPQTILHGINQDHLPELLKVHENECYEVKLDDSWSFIHSEYGLSGNNNPQPSDAWKSNLVWDSSPCLSEMSTNYKCYT